MSTPESKLAALAATKAVAEDKGSVALLFDDVDDVGDEALGRNGLMLDFFNGILVTYIQLRARTQRALHLCY